MFRRLASLGRVAGTRLARGSRWHGGIVGRTRRRETSVVGGCRGYASPASRGLPEFVRHRLEVWEREVVPLLAEDVSGPGLADAPEDAVGVVDEGGAVVDLSSASAATGDCWVTLDSPEGQDMMWHSSAHVLGHALELYFAQQGHTILLDDGPALDREAGPAGGGGFYYDYHGGHTLEPSQYKAVEKLVRQLCNKKEPFVRATVPREVAREMFAYSPVKQELLERIPSDAPVGLYKCGNFIDLCRGPHVPSTGMIKSATVVTSSGLEADPQGPAITGGEHRVYGMAFPTKDGVKKWKQWRREAERRDHRVLGKKLDLWMLHAASPGSAIILPHGLRIYNALVTMIRKQYTRRGFEEISTPLIWKRSLFETSGHWDNYAKDMYRVSPCCPEEHGAAEGDDDHEEMALKPMNCPGHCLVYDAKPRSYRDLPLRMADFSQLHRCELSGALSGLTRLRRFCQDDAHIFCAPEQIQAQVQEALSFVDDVYRGIFDLEYSLRLSTRPDKYIGSRHLWDDAEQALANALDAQVPAAASDCSQSRWAVNPGDGAFYGPKIDVTVTDALRRQHQCGTIQLDFNLPQRFGLTYHTADGTSEQPVMVHRAVLGSVERFMAMLTEHTAAKFPLWCSPRQVLVCPVSHTHRPYAESVRTALHAACPDIAVDVFPTDASVAKQIRHGEKTQYNYLLVVGDDECNNNVVNVRARDSVVLGAMSIHDLATQLDAQMSPLRS